MRAARIIMKPRLRTLLIRAFALVACAVLACLSGLSGAFAQSADNAKQVAPSDEGKLDVTDLEKKYWAAKDTDFSVVQNRAYSKAGRLAATLQYGYYVRDTYSEVSEYRLALNYYFSERFGAELNYEVLDSVNSKATNAFVNQYGGVFPNHGKQREYYGAAFNWIPIYAKMSLLNSRIIYFDMAFSPGVGMTTYEQQVQGSYPKASAPTLSFDISQHFFLAKWFALRFDFQNRWFNEEVKNFRTGAAASTELNHTSVLSFGAQFFY